MEPAHQLASARKKCLGLGLGHEKIVSMRSVVGRTSRVEILQATALNPEAHLKTSTIRRGGWQCKIPGWSWAADPRRDIDDPPRRMTVQGINTASTAPKQTLIARTAGPGVVQIGSGFRDSSGAGPPLGCDITRVWN